MTSENLLAAFTTTVMDFHNAAKNSQSCFLRTQKMNSYGCIRRAMRRTKSSQVGEEITRAGGGEQAHWIQRRQGRMR